MTSNYTFCKWSSRHCNHFFQSKDKYCFITRVAIWSDVPLCQSLGEHDDLMPKQSCDLALSRARLGVQGNKRWRSKDRDMWLYMQVHTFRNMIFYVNTLWSTFISAPALLPIKPWDGVYFQRVCSALWDHKFCMCSSIKREADSRQVTVTSPRCLCAYVRLPGWLRFSVSVGAKVTARPRGCDGRAAQDKARDGAGTRSASWQQWPEVTAPPVTSVPGGVTAVTNQ